MALIFDGEMPAADEEEMLLAEEAPRRRRPGLRTLAAVATAAGALAVVAAGRGGGLLGARVDAVQEAVEQPSGEEVAKRLAARTKLHIEKDLSTYITAHLPRGAKPSGKHSPDRAAGVLFDHVVESSNMEKELTAQEREAFRARFVAKMVAEAKEDQEAEKGWTLEYIQEAQAALESQKPVVTEAFANSLNEAKLGFSTKARSWMTKESKEDFQKRLGRTQLPADKKKELEEEGRGSGGSRDPTCANLPVAFDSREKWPECQGVIGRIHNQGLCGSCWVFGALGPLDSRMCIKTRGKGDSGIFAGNLAMLSRGYATSCASEGFGCMGGFEYNVYQYIERSEGLPSDRCSPYFASGEGSHHFDSSQPTPPCPGACQPRFPKSLSESKFKPVGVGKSYRLVLTPTEDDLQALRCELMNGGPVAFGIYADGVFMGYNTGIFTVCARGGANHAVHTIGWGEGYFLGQNSWGPDWGDEGRFKVSPCVLTDYTVPGSIEPSDFAALPIPTELNPAPQPNPAPAPSPSQSLCKKDADGCITSPNFPGKYGSSEGCVIDASQFDTIRVESFETEEKYDYLTVNGKEYSGTSGPDGVQVNKNNDIMWSSDFSWNKKGWKICPAA